MSFPFGVVMTKTVPPVATEARWIVTMRRGGSWPGWRWLDTAITKPHWEQVPPSELSLIEGALMALAVTASAGHWVAYHARRRHDWDVLVFDGTAPDDRRSSALRIESCPTRGAAASRAEQLWTHLCTYNALPDD